MMRLVSILYVMLLVFLLAFFLATQARKTDWIKERDDQIWGYLCRATGGENFRMDGWTAICEYPPSKKKEIVWP